MYRAKAAIRARLRESAGWIAPQSPGVQGVETPLPCEKCLRHDPEKWGPVFRKGHAPNPVHSFARALRLARLPRKFRALTACRTADFAAVRRAYREGARCLSWAIVTPTGPAMPSRSKSTS